MYRCGSHPRDFAVSLRPFSQNWVAQSTAMVRPRCCRSPLEWVPARGGPLFVGQCRICAVVLIASAARVPPKSLTWSRVWCAGSRSFQHCQEGCAQHRGEVLRALDVRLRLEQEGHRRNCRPPLQAHPKQNFGLCDGMLHDPLSECLP